MHRDNMELARGSLKPSQDLACSSGSWARAQSRFTFVLGWTFSSDKCRAMIPPWRGVGVHDQHDAFLPAYRGRKECSQPSQFLRRKHEIMRSSPCHGTREEVQVLDARDRDDNSVVDGK